MCNACRRSSTVGWSSLAGGVPGAHRRLVDGHSECDALLRRQHAVVSRAQLHDRGLTYNGITAQVAAGRWQRPLPGVIVVFTGPLPALTTCCAALLYAGADAVLSHSTAGVLWQLVP